MWVRVLWTSPIPIWPKQRCLVCRDKLLCGFESFEPHQYLWSYWYWWCSKDSNPHSSLSLHTKHLCFGHIGTGEVQRTQTHIAACPVGLSPLNLTNTNMTKTEMFSVQGQAAMWVWVLWYWWCSKDSNPHSSLSLHTKHLCFGHIGTGGVQRTQTHIAACPCTLNISVLVILVLVRLQAAMWVWVLWTSPVPIWPKQRCLVCRDKLLCGFESFEPHQYQYDKNRDV
jgi:hypothetical protein